jgi:multidrug efflux pump subunit AcrA (membrane-fusion protein)
MALPFGRRSAAPGDDAPAPGIDELLSTEAVTTVEEETTSAPSRSQGWGRLLRGNRTMWIVAAVAVASLIAGLVLGQFIVSPGQAAADAKAPKAGLITVPVESRELGNDVTIRGDATYADSVEVTLETGDLGGPAVVTGQVPAVGATLGAGAIALEVTGRPVIVLPGDLPVYRTLRVGVSGPDVTQLKQALQALGINPGSLASATYDAATAAGVAALYDRVGYPLPESAEGGDDSLRSATEAVASAKNQVAAAQRELAVAAAGATGSARLEQDNNIRLAQRAFQAAVDSGEADAHELATLQDAISLQLTLREELLAPRDTSTQAAAVAAATQQLTAANEALAEAKSGSLTILPASEVLYLPGLPRRVDEITVKRGATISGGVMRVSGATLVISGSASEADAKLLTEGAAAVLELPDGTEHPATVATIAPAEAAEGSTETSGRFTVTLTPAELTPEQLQAIQGSNVRVNIPVSSTDGAVLAVPLAALTAGAGGESRVEVSTGDDDETKLVEVTTGLAADGYVEVTGVDEELAEGDLVVVGR